MGLSFENTENAFKGKSNYELNRSYWLFKLISSPSLVKIGAATAPLALNMGFKGIFKKTIFKQFVGGETIQDCAKAIQELSIYNVGTILDYSVEGKESEEDFNHCCTETIETIHRSQHDKHIPFCVFKVTGLARFALLEKISASKNLLPEEQEEWKKAKERVTKICAAAHQAQKPIFIDAEESWIQQAIDDLCDENMMAFNKEKAIVYNTFQLYRKDRLAFLHRSLEKARKNNYFLGAKLVRGAYMEKERLRAEEHHYPSPIQDNKTNTDQDYNKALEFCLQHIDKISICAGTHNEDSSMLLVQLMEKSGLKNNDNRIYFSQLLGMSNHISFNLSLSGYNVAKYVPYGPIKEVMPYLIRRAQENTSVKGQTGRELSLIIKEKKRRNGKDS